MPAARPTVAVALPHPLPALPSIPFPAPSPLQNAVTSTLASTDYDAVVVPLTNAQWRDRWERLCLRPLEDDEGLTRTQLDARELEREVVDREADVWRKEGGLRREEVNVCRLEETQHLIGVAAEWLELDSPDEGIRFDSELALRAEVSHALYLSLPTLILPAPSLANRANLPSYARAVSNLLQLGGPSAYTQLSIRIPVSDPLELIGQGPSSLPGQLPVPDPVINGPGPNAHPNGQANGGGETSKAHKRVSSLSIRQPSVHAGGAGLMPNGAANGMRNASGASAASSMMSARSGVQVSHGDPSSTWEMWDTVRNLCGYHPRLSVTLDLTNPLPPSVGALARWTSEPVKHVWLPAGSFIPNAKGYPVLSKASQAFLKGINKQSPTFILSDTSLTRHPSGGPSAYIQYLRHITSQPAASGSTSSMGVLADNIAEEYKGYTDFLQAPLQPLMDDLGSATYDVFERDPVKYRQYEEAIFLALSEMRGDVKHVITVVGAGRGPLVACALKALKRSNRKAAVYAVEKNANAFVTLQERKALEWRDSVEILYGDMRSLDVPEQADILVSELLGSFGDNELSPECLDGAMRFLKPSGVSIPTSYTAHLAPISSAKLFADVTSPSRASAAPETPYVVMMNQVNILSGDGPGAGGRCGERIQQCWQFEHPRRDLILDASGAPLTNSHNTRSSTLVFSIPTAATCHGLAGYFEAHLFGNVGLSTHPENAHRVSPEMFSWFPIYFPFRAPLYLPSGSEMEVNIWRLADGRGRKVWYEWCAEAYLPVGGYVGAGVGMVANGNMTPNANLSGAGVRPRTPTSARTAGGGGGPLSPLMDATFSPGLAMSTGHEGRVKIGQTGLHNPGGCGSWVGL